MLVKKITLEWLEERGACHDGVEWFEEKAKTDSVEVINSLIAENKLEWANWLIVRVMDRPQYLSYAIFAAEQVIDIFESVYPEDNRPRMAIAVARAVLENDTEKTRDAARAAWYAAWAAAGDAARAPGDAWYAAWAAAGDAARAPGDARAAAWAAAGDAARAPGAAGDAAWAAARAAGAAGDAARAAGAAGAARNAARAAGAAGDAMRLRILQYGLSLLEKEKASAR